MRGTNEGELADFVALTRDRPLDVRFIEWMPFDSNQWNTREFVPYAEMLDGLREAYPDLQREGDGPNDTSKWWRVPGHAGRVAFITSMSEHFCGSCNRVRVTADGNLKTCLFGNEELSLRDHLRAGAADWQLAHLVSRMVDRKHFALGGHGDMHGIAASDNRPMVLIGG